MSFSNWILEMEEKFNIGFTYNHSLLDNLTLHVSDCHELNDCLAALSLENPLQFERSNNEQFLIFPVRAPVVFSVQDSETNETVEALQVSINSGQELYLLPRQNEYSIPDLFPTDSLLIRSRFYTSTSVSAQDLSEMSGPMLLSPDTIYLQEVVIEDYLSNGVDSRLSDHSMHVDMKSLGLLAGETDGDVLNVLKSLPGIRTPDGKPGSLNFRGSTFDHTLIIFDEIPIYHSGHFFGTISPYNPAAVSRISIHRGTLPARWGGRVGGLINLQTENTIADSSRYSASANTVYAGLTLNAPVKKEKLGVSIAARSNYPIDYLPPKLDAFRTLNFQGSRIDPNLPGIDRAVEQFDIRFQDFNGKLIFKPNERNQATLSFINIQNRFLYVFDAPNSNSRERQVSDLDNWGITGKWKTTLSDGLDLATGATTSSLTIFESNSENMGGMPRRGEDISNTIDDLRLFANAKYRVSERSTFDVGYQFVNQKVTLDEQEALNRPRSNRRDDAQIHSFYINSQSNWGNRLLTNVGIHSYHYSPLNRQYFDPRVSLSFMVSESFYLKASGGRAHQFIKRKFNNDFDDFRLQNQFWSLANRMSPVLKGTQGMIGFLYDRSGWLLDVEFYSKKTKGVTRQNSPSMDLNGDLLTTGTDIFIKKRWTRFETWIGYSISDVQVDFNSTLTAFFNQRHLLNLTAIHHFDRWNFAASWSYQSGMPVLIPPLDPNDPGSNGQTMLRIPYSGTFPSQHQLDLSVTYKFLKRENQWRGVLGLSLLNVYDRKNVINIFQNNPRVQQPFRYAVGFAPNFSVGLNF